VTGQMACLVINWDWSWAGVLGIETMYGSREARTGENSEMD
jgi:hypothetical protein